MNLPKNYNPTITNKLSNILESFFALNKYSFNTNFSLVFSSIILILFLFSFLFVLQKKDNLRTLLLFFILIVLGTSVYLTFKYPHYFGIIYPFYYILIAYFLSLLVSSSFGKIIVTVFLIIYIFLNYQGYYFLSAKENKQIDVAKKIASVIRDNIDRNEFRLTALPQQYNDYTYRYFLELWGKKPIEKSSLERTSTLFVVCEEECKPIGDAQWDVAYFAPRKIVGTWKVDNVTIYRLTH